MTLKSRKLSFQGLASIAAAPLFILSTGMAAAVADTPDPTPVQLGGTLPDGTTYQMIVPEDWNGTLISDLDAAGRITRSEPITEFLLDQGYAYAGTARRADRIYRFDPAQERDNQARVIDTFSEKFGEPETTIQYGCSGGGGVALGIAETYPNKIDGAIALNAADGLNMSNQRLDLLFALKATLAPESDLPLVAISYEDREAAANAWGDMLESAAATDQGRARIALAGTIAQVPAWEGSAATDEEALISSTIESAVYAAGIRYLYDNPAGVMSWNTGVDYQDFYNSAEPRLKNVARELYTKAGLKGMEALQTDLAAVNTFPRIEATQSGIDYWKTRVLTANPGVPVLQGTTAGDNTRWNGINAAYAEGVRANGKNSLYRQAVIGASGHCTHSISEVGALIETMLQRIENGHWANSTKPEALNAAGQKFGMTEPRFIATDALAVKSFRTAFPNSEYPQGR